MVPSRAKAPEQSEALLLRMHVRIVRTVARLPAEVAGEGQDQEGLSVDRRHASEALPCKSFEPIGRHVRIVRVTLQDCRPILTRGETESDTMFGGSLPLPLSREAGVSYSSSTVIKSPSHGGPSGPYRDSEIA